MNNAKKIIFIVTKPIVLKILPNTIYKKLKNKYFPNKFNLFSFKNIKISKRNKLFSNIDVDTIKLLFPDSITNVIDLSEKYVQGKFCFLGANFNFISNINWHFDPNDKVEWEYTKYDERKIHYKGSPKDVKIIWELNRHQYFFTLAKGYYLTGNINYVNCIISHIKSWIEQNANYCGINWASSLEVSIRLISWICAIDLIEDTSIYKENEEIINKEIYKHILFLKNHLSDDRLLHTNHLIGELSGLIFACLFYDFTERDKIFNKSLKSLEKELKNQIYSDGVSKEQSASYHRFIIDFLTLIVVFSNKLKITFSDHIKNTLEKMISYVSKVISTTCIFPMYGDADNGRGFKFDENSNFWDFSHILSNGTILFKKVEFKKNISFSEESFWLFGKEGKKIFDSIDNDPNNEIFNYYEKAGHCIYKNYNSGIYFFVRGGDFGMGGSFFSSHSHFDLLSPIIDFGNQSFIVDSGTYIYNGDPENRNRFRDSMSHNNITWNTKIAIPKLNFGWLTVCNSKLIKKEIINNIIKLTFILSKVKHYKRTFTINNNTIIITDIFNKSFNNIKWNFHLHPLCKYKLNDKSNIDLENNGIKVNFCCNKDNLKIEDSEISFNYGIKERNKCISLNIDVQKNEEIVFVISRNVFY